MLPQRRRFANQPISAAISKLLGRAAVITAQPGELAQLQRYFEIIPAGWPMAALSRQLDCGDAGEEVWLRADPAYIRPDVRGARLVAWGNMDLSEPEATQLFEAVRPAFSDLGLLLSMADAQRWYLKIPPHWTLPNFADPLVALGGDLLAHLPQGEDDRRWRAILNDAQIILHNHPLNEQRRSSGRTPINSIWFWGAGQLPAIVNSPAGRVDSASHEIKALAACVAELHSLQAADSVLTDLRNQRDWAALEAGALGAALQPPLRGKDSLIFDFADGRVCMIDSRARWKVFSRPIGAQFFSDP